MNDHIAKPINVKDMFETMAKWIIPSTPFTPSNIKNNTRSTTQGNEIAFPHFHHIALKAGLISTQQNKSLYHKLLLRFYRSQLSFAEDFMAAQQSEDPNAAQRNAHSLKGAAGTIGAFQLAEAAGKLEQRCIENQELSGNELSNVLNELTIVLEELSTLQETTKTADTTLLMSEADIKHALTELRNYLEEDDNEANYFITALVPKLAGTKYIRALEKIEALVDEYRFDDALELLKSI